MAGIYFHIPFCKVKCSYCDFYKTTEINKIDIFLNAVKKEIKLQKDYLTDKKIETIYFGGGTPSLLTASQINELIDLCYYYFVVDNAVEITLEANPDDITRTYIKEIVNSRINRISIGIQSLNQGDLKLMKRRHNASQALEAVEIALKEGLTNISVDLIYGIPGMTFEQWQHNLYTVFNLEVKHISAYHLTYHEKTRLWDDLYNGKISEIEENQSVMQFEELIKVAENKGFIHYEISNFAKEGYYSNHNSAYWKQKEYLGLGPSAHSYNKLSRQWNVSNLSDYITAISDNIIPCQIEILTEKDRFNDFIITSLRTIWGIDLVKVEHDFGENYLKYLYEKADKFLKNKQLILKNNQIHLAKSGIFISDLIAENLIM